MELLEQIQAPLVLVASIITALTIVVGAYEKWWLKPREARREKERADEQKQTIELVETIVQPFKEFTRESSDDRKKINTRLDDFTEDLKGIRSDVSGQNGRIQRVEEKVGITTYIQYKEEY